MHPAYFESRFHIDRDLGFPREFAILSAHATTGEQWSDAKNREADRSLRNRLVDLGCTPIRIVGYSTSSEHAEPSWITSLGFDLACDIGNQYLQDALYYVIDDELYVSHCDQRRGLIFVGPFRARVGV